MNLTIFIIIITGTVSIIGFRNREVFDKLKFNAYMVWHKRDYGRLFGHGLLHADWMHLIMNMLVLYFFADVVESSFMQIAPFAGKFLFMLMYVLAIPISTIPSLIKYKSQHYYNSVGASGAVSAVLFASILFAPNSSIVMLFFPFPIKSYIWGTLYLLYSYYMGKRNSDNIGHNAHITGAIFGFLFPLLIQPSLIIRFFNLIF